MAKNPYNALEVRIQAIEARNTRVELDKSWERSLTRRLSIAISTYIVIVCYLVIIHNDQPFINAFVPSIGYFLSTLVLKQVRRVWQSQKQRRT